MLLKAKNFRVEKQVQGQKQMLRIFFYSLMN
jgi:hypothetical protein